MTKPVAIVFGVDGTNVDEVATYLAKRYDTTCQTTDGWLRAHNNTDVATLIIMHGEAATRKAEQDAFEALMDSDGVVAIGGSTLEDDDARQAVRDAQDSGTIVVRCEADMADISKRLGLNKPRSVALGPVRMQIQTFKNARDKVWADIVPDIICDTSNADWKNHLGT